MKQRSATFGKFYDWYSLFHSKRNGTGKETITEEMHRMIRKRKTITSTIYSSKWKGKKSYGVNKHLNHSKYHQLFEMERIFFRVQSSLIITNKSEYAVGNWVHFMLHCSWIKIHMLTNVFWSTSLDYLTWQKAATRRSALLALICN